MNNNVLEAVIASTFSPDLQIDIRRTPYILSMEAVLEVVKKGNEKLHSGAPLQLLNKAPKKRKEWEPLEEPPKVIGGMVECFYSEDQTNGCKQAIAKFELFDEVDRILRNKTQLAIFPLISYNPTESLKLAVKTEDAKDDVYYVYPPLNIAGFNVGDKRSSSNPYLKII